MDVESHIQEAIMDSPLFKRLNITDTKQLIEQIKSLVESTSENLQREVGEALELLSDFSVGQDEVSAYPLNQDKQMKISSYVEEQGPTIKKQKIIFLMME